MTSQQRLLDVIRRHNEEVDELCISWERRNTMSKDNVVPEGEYIVKAKECHMNKSMHGSKEYGTLEFEVIDGKWKGRSLFSVFAGAFKLDVDHRQVLDTVHANVCGIMQSLKVKKFADEKGLMD